MIDNDRFYKTVIIDHYRSQAEAYFLNKVTLIPMFKGPPSFKGPPKFIGHPKLKIHFWWILECRSQYRDHDFRIPRGRFDITNTKSVFISHYRSFSIIIDDLRFKFIKMIWNCQKSLEYGRISLYQKCGTSFVHFLYKIMIFSLFAFLTHVSFRDCKSKNVDLELQ